MKTNLSTYNNSWYSPGGSAIKRFAWFFTNAIIFKTSLVPVSSVKVSLLRLFGAKMGVHIELKPCVNIKYPWLLEVGDDTWIGENVWIDNLAPVKIGANACLSQGAMLLTGNHDYKKSSFDLMVRSIILEEGVWIGAQSMVCPGVTAYSHSILSAGSVATKDMEAYGIYQGNPAVKVRERVITDN